jgi:ankyrin
MRRCKTVLLLLALIGCPSAAPPPNRELLDIKPAAPRDLFNQALVTNDVARMSQLLDEWPQVSPNEFMMGCAASSHQQGGEMARMLVARGADVNLSGGKLINTAAANNNLPVARLLLEHGGNPNVTDSFCGSPLHIASMRGCDEMIELLLKHQADPNIRDTKGRTPLMIAAIGKPSKAWDLLIAAGADPNLKDNAGTTALDYKAARDVGIAIENNDIALLNQAIAAGPGSLKLRTVYGWHWGGASSVVRLGRAEMLKAMIAGGLDVNLTDVNGTTLLHEAARAGRAEMARLLIQAGAKVDARGVDGQTPLRAMCEPMTTTRVGDAKPPAPDFAATRAVLIAAGADVNARDRNGQTPAFDPDPQAVRDLVKRGADINVQDNYNATPLRDAAISGNWELARTLIELGARQDIISACAMGDIELVKQFLAADPKQLDLRWENPNENHLDWTPLVVACKHDRREVAKLLIQRGAEVNRGYWGWGLTPLQQAIEHDDVELARMLIQRGAKTKFEEGDVRDQARSDAMRRVLSPP